MNRVRFFHFEESMHGLYLRQVNRDFVCLLDEVECSGEFPLFLAY